MKTTTHVCFERRPGSKATIARSFRAVLLSAAVGTIIPSGAAWAQEAATSAQVGTGTTSADSLQVIVVTAQRRDENLQDVPIAATVLGGGQLDSRAVDAVADLQFVAPSLSVTDAGETQSVNIRGIGIASNSPNISNGVATYIDGLFQPPIVTSIPFYDIGTIEVLRGPQGTLVGNNSTGGAIFINSANPSVDVINGYAKGAIGNYGLQEIEGALNVPLGSTLAVRAAGIFTDRGSYYDDVGPFDNDAGKLHEIGGRLGLLWEPGAFRALVKLQWHEQDTGGYAYRPAPGTDFAPFAVGDIRTLSYDHETAKVERAFLASAELRYEFGGGLVLRSLSGYQYKRNTYLADTDASQAPPSAGGGLSTDYFAGEKQYNQEINVISPTDGAFDWILGGYYQHNDIVVNINNMAPPGVMITPRNSKDILGFFGQANYQLVDRLELQLGARYSHFNARGTGTVVLGQGAPGFPPSGIVLSDLAGNHKDSMVTGKAALNWTVADDHLLYAFAARGYKPGGFNCLPSPQCDQPEFDPETVWNYEIGWKGSLADRRVNVQLAAFYNDFKNFQFDVIETATGTNGVRNVGSAIIKGFEAQIQARFGGLGLDAGVGYLDTKLSSLTFVNTRLLPPGQLGPQCAPGVPSNPPACFDYGPFIITTSGGNNLYSPKWTFNGGIEYVIDLSDGVSLTPRVNYGYVGSRFNYLAYGPGDLLPSRALVSALVTLRVNDITVEAYGTNLTDKEYVAGRSGDNEFYGAPLEYGLRVGVRF
ncbi:MAG: TonB-dependent receptor [Alphaproteobacteria bacterium]|nr:TonB-dependent receptor [Alphaproteobacteria bacterium]MBU0792573.1 TonB-dependent receptor [Alphaproteobacteria bacterium]MBU0874782.1 TonB-dependent receptor [Alphaproteobacteria bacterium]MBU1768640.1 TonB-dependent receptor [Alphaproteobacteria bacterium]